MVIYIASNSCNETISSACSTNEELVVGAESSNDFNLQKYVKQNATQFQGIDKFIVDLEACVDFDEEIIASIISLKLIYDKLRIIVIAGNRQPGDDLLTKIFNLGITDIICSEDKVVIKSELLICLNEGKSFRDALIFKDAKKEKIVIKNEIKQVVEKVMIGVAGSQERIGVTHNAIILANFLRKKGFSVALAEYNESNFIPKKANEKFNSFDEKIENKDIQDNEISGDLQDKDAEKKKDEKKTAFQGIQDSFDEQLLDGWYFNLNNIDYYPNCNNERLSHILGKSYNFIIVDFGVYEKCDRITFSKCAERIILAGANPWEIEKVNSIFEITTAESVKNMNFCFNFVSEDLQNEVKDNMADVGDVYFLKFSNSPFEEWDYSGADLFLKKYMPVTINMDEKEKKSLFTKIFKKKSKKREKVKNSVQKQED